MISFEMKDMPNAHRVTSDEFRAIYEIVDQDWSRNYVITDARDTAQGLWFLIVERMRDGDQETETYFRVDFDGDWGVLYQLREGEGFCWQCSAPSDESGPQALCAYHRDHAVQG